MADNDTGLPSECDEIADRMPVPADTTWDAAKAVAEAQIAPENRQGSQWMDNIIQRLQERAGEQLRIFQTAIRICADDVQRLRSCDVYRAISVAHDCSLYNFCGDGPHIAQTKAFIAWLREQRPDLKAQIDADVAFIEEDEGIKLTETA